MGTAIIELALAMERRCKGLWSVLCDGFIKCTGSGQQQPNQVEWHDIDCVIRLLLQITRRRMPGSSRTHFDCRYQFLDVNFYAMLHLTEIVIPSMKRVHLSTPLLFIIRTVSSPYFDTVGGRIHSQPLFARGFLIESDIVSFQILVQPHEVGLDHVRAYYTCDDGTK